MMRGVKRMMLGLVTMLIIFLAFAGAACAQETNSGKRLYVVYDNSDSMNDNEAWDKAAYAMETIVAMMDEQDIVTVYFMTENNDYYIKESFTKGDGLERLKNTLEKLEATDNTYINGLEQAIRDINNDGSEGAQLLILSDGVFNMRGAESIEDMEINLERELPGVRTIYFRMGSKGDVQTEEEDVRVTGVTESFETTENNILTQFAEIANMIYDRQNVEFVRNGSTGTFQLELPAKRLIILNQSNEGRVSEQGTIISSTEFEEIFNKSFSSTNNTEQYYGNVRIYKSDDLIPRGKYSLSVSGEVESKIYVEYDVEYSIQIVSEQEGIWEFEEGTNENPDDLFREGRYTFEVKLKDTQREEIIEEAGIYNKLEWNLKLDDAEIIEKDTEVFLSEGKHVVSGGFNLEGNYPQDINVDFEIKHQLGELDINIELPERGLDIDALGEGENMIFISLLENKEIIDGYDSLTLEVLRGPNSPYEYKIVAAQGGWRIYPSILEDQKRDLVESDEELEFKITGEKEGQVIQKSEKSQIPFYVLPKDITFQNTSIRFNDVIGLLLRREIRIEPLIDGKAIEIKEGIKKIDPTLSDFSGVEGITGTISYFDEESLQIVLRLHGITGFWKLLKGGAVSGELDIALERYGERCHGSEEIVIQVGEIRSESIIIITILIVLLLYIVTAHILLKGIFLKSRLWFVPITVECKVRYGEKIKIIEIPVSRQRFLNFFRPLYPKVTISLKEIDYLNISASIPDRLILRKVKNGQGIVVNIDRFISCESVYKNGRKLTDMDADFEWDEGLNWELSGRRSVKIRVVSEGRY